MNNNDDLKDFSMVLALLPALESNKEFESLPKLFSIVGIDRLLILCKYMGGRSVRIPTLHELTITIEAVQWYIDVYILKNKNENDIPTNLRGQVSKIWHIIDDKQTDAKQNQTDN